MRSLETLFFVGIFSLVLAGSELAEQASADQQPVADTQPAGPKPLAAQETLERIAVPDGFQVSLFAAEPHVRQPIAMTFDDRGRLWVVECYSYPDYKHEKTDRVLIFEDHDGDGQFDERKVFWDEGTRLTGIQVGFGGVWLCSAPNLLFIPDANGDDVPDGEPQVVLDGWNVWDVQHNIFNGLTWGPDGWLYGRHGILAESRVGKPGTPDEQRPRMNCGIWRYHPTREVFEVVAHGTTNPWGLDFNDQGEGFFSNSVNGHLWHLIPGAHYQRMYGNDYNPHFYELIEVTADHRHWAGELWFHDREGQDDHGGGHAHSGAMIYLGDNWPDRYRNTFFACNIHGNRVNNDLLERHQSGYVGRHGRDFLLANDPWFRGIDIKVGPDGGVYIIDWHDLGECHDHDGSQRSTGRIYKVTYDKPRPAASRDLSRLSDDELVALQLHKNDWLVRQSRRLLQERAAAGKNLDTARQALLEILNTHPDDTRRLRALWALNALQSLDEMLLVEQLHHPSEHLRAWAVRLLCEEKTPSEAVLEKFVALASDDSSDLVRLYLAAMLQRLPLAQRTSIAAALVARPTATADRTLTLMMWYGIEPLVAADVAAARQLAERAQIPLLRQYIARRVTSAQQNESPVIEWVAESSQVALQRDLLHGLEDALRGRRNEKMPTGWDRIYDRLVTSDDASLRAIVRRLAVIFGDARVMEAYRAILLDADATVESRAEALQVLVEQRQAGLAPHLHTLVSDRAVRGAVIRALAAYDDSRTPQIVLEHYPTLTTTEKRDAISTLSSRREYARELLAAIDRGTIARDDLLSWDVRQIQGLGDEQLTRQLETVWGMIRQSSQEKQKIIADYKNLLHEGNLARANLGRGRVLYNRLCAQCHTLYGEGGKIGPDLTGSNRADMHYLLENLIDPSATVAQSYRMSTLITADGRVLSGIVSERDERTLEIQTANERLVLDRDDIDALRPSEVSMMPEGLIERLSDDELRDLAAYLATKSQVPLPPGQESADTSPASESSAGE